MIKSIYKHRVTRTLGRLYIVEGIWCWLCINLRQAERLAKFNNLQNNATIKICFFTRKTKSSKISVQSAADEVTSLSFGGEAFRGPFCSFFQWEVNLPGGSEKQSSKEPFEARFWKEQKYISEETNYCRGWQILCIRKNICICDIYREVDAYT